MWLQEPSKLLKLWLYSFEQGVRVVLMRHAPKVGSDGSDLSQEGIELAKRYGDVLTTLDFYQPNKFGAPFLFCTGKKRTTDTLKLLFPDLPTDYLSDLEVNKVSPFVQDQCNELHARIGHFRRYYLNHTYYFLEKLGGRFDEENPHTVVAERMARGIRSLFDYERPAIYCGHSPSIEVGLEKLLGLSLSELGGFLNPLDSIHLRINDNRIELVARINPIVGYIDLESESYFYR